MKRNTRK